MTRVAYAQLKGQVFHPPRTFGPEWRVPPLTEDEALRMSDEERVRREDERRWRDVGCKIIMGFEIMYREDNKRSRGQETVDEGDPAYIRYLDNLKKAKFFGENVEGSREWTARMREAQRGWIAVREERCVASVVRLVSCSPAPAVRQGPHSPMPSIPR